MSQQPNQINNMKAWHIYAKLGICCILNGEMVVTSNYETIYVLLQICAFYSLLHTDI